MLVYQRGLLINGDYSGKTFVDSCYNNQVICDKNVVDCHNNSQVVVCGKNFTDKCPCNNQVVSYCGSQNFADGTPNNQVVVAHNEDHPNDYPLSMNTTSNNSPGLNPEAKPFRFLKKEKKKKINGLNPDAKPFEHSSKTIQYPNGESSSQHSHNGLATSNSLNPNATPFELTTTTTTTTTFGYPNSFKYEVPCIMSEESTSTTTDGCTTTAKIYDHSTQSLCHMGMNTGEISQLSYSYEDQISPLNPNALPYDPSMILTSSEQQPKRPNLCPLMRSNAAVAAPAACAVPNCQTLNVGSYYNCYNITIYKYMKTGPSV